MWNSGKMGVHSLDILFPTNAADFSLHMQACDIPKAAQVRLELSRKKNHLQDIMQQLKDQEKSKQDYTKSVIGKLHPNLSYMKTDVQ